jgi:hypothetical protein
VPHAIRLALGSLDLAMLQEALRTIASVLESCTY